MAAKNQVVGQARVKIDGELLETDGSSTLEIGGPNRESVLGDYSASSFRETTAASKLECAVLVKPGTSVGRFAQVTGATITIEFDTGQTWMIRDGWSAEAPSINQSDGKAKLVFMGEPAEELS